jgi:hypothetical protein
MRMLRRRRNGSGKKKIAVPRQYTYARGGSGMGKKALVHKGEIILANPFRSTRHS